MSTRFKKYHSKVSNTGAAEILQENHPFSSAFAKFCGHNAPSKRQARKFLQRQRSFRKSA